GSGLGTRERDSGAGGLELLLDLRSLDHLLAELVVAVLLLRRHDHLRHVLLAGVSAAVGTLVLRYSLGHRRGLLRARRGGAAGSGLLDLAVERVLPKNGIVLAQFHPAGRVAAVLGGGVARGPRRFGALEDHLVADVFPLGHGGFSLSRAG